MRGTRDHTIPESDILKEAESGNVGGASMMPRRRASTQQLHVWAAKLPQGVRVREADGLQRHVQRLVTVFFAMTDATLKEESRSAAAAAEEHLLDGIHPLLLRQRTR